MIEMAQQTAKRCTEKREKRAGCPVERFDTADQSRLRVPSEYQRFAPQQRRKPLKTERFPAGSLLVSKQIASYHFNQMNGS